MNRLTLTTKSGKAKCLNYRNGKRCGRVAVVELCTPGRIIYARKSHLPRVVCAECAVSLVGQYGQDVVRGVSRKGFKVSERGTEGWVSRHYKAIG